jgi:biopolymer transport protein ExbB
LLHYEDSSDRIRSAIQAAAIVEIPLLERRIGTLAALARIAPLMGFLGTLIAALQALYQLEGLNSNSSEFSRLLAEALVSSAFGVAIGILATLAHHFLFGRVRALVHDFEWAGHTLYELLTVGDAKEDISSGDEGEQK